VLARLGAGITSPRRPNPRTEAVVLEEVEREDGWDDAEEPEELEDEDLENLDDDDLVDDENDADDE
jgi:hypothetical protein